MRLCFLRIISVYVQYYYSLPCINVNPREWIKVNIYRGVKITNNMNGLFVTNICLQCHPGGTSKLLLDLLQIMSLDSNGK